MTESRASVVVHGHFYQPPREDPWSGEVPREPSAAPYHDWNARIEAECYGPVTRARVIRGDGVEERTLNCLSRMSFDVGPTLLSWLERHASGTYQRILEADRESARRNGGHGSAIAMPFHHVILPLASRRDKVTEVRWGVADFRRRFGRDPEGIWLPETAVDDETLDVVAEEGLRFTVLAPAQVEATPEGGLPGLYRTAGGREVAVFVYDGPISHDIAFGPLLTDASRWVERAREGARRADVVLAATDGETFGHHHTFGEMALAAFLERIEDDPGLDQPGLAALLERHPPTEEVEVVSPSSWSCVHGVGRWARACGCRLDPSRETQQAWRAPLREGLEALARGLHDLFEREAGGFFDDPWEVRNACADVVAWEDDLERLVRERAAHPLGDAAARRAGELLAMERNALRMFTSCGWFFDDLARIEALQVLRYAARAIELAGPEVGAGLELALLETLAAARSNDPAEGSGADLYLRRIGARHTAGVGS